MPIGVVLASNKRFDLESLPEAYIIVRRMTYGEELSRSGMATKFKVGGTGKDPRNADAFQGELDIDTKIVALWDFANLIIEHNITDETERLLNFKNPVDVNRLHPEVGKEIGRYIDEWNSAKETEETKNS